MRAAQLRGSGDKLNNLKFRSEDTVTIDHTKEEADCPTVTGFEGDPPHSGYAVDKGGLHDRPDTEANLVECMGGNTVRPGPVWCSSRNVRVKYLFFCVLNCLTLGLVLLHQSKMCDRKLL